MGGGGELGACGGVHVQEGRGLPNALWASEAWDPRGSVAEADSDLPPFIYCVFKTMLLIHNISGSLTQLTPTPVIQLVLTLERCEGGGADSGAAYKNLPVNFGSPQNLVKLLFTGNLTIA